MNLFQRFLRAVLIGPLLRIPNGPYSSLLRFFFAVVFTFPLFAGVTLLF